MSIADTVFDTFVQNTDTFDTAKYFLSMDINHAFQQPIVLEHRPYAAFLHIKVFINIRGYPWGMLNSSNSFQRSMNMLFSGLLYQSHVDDLVACVNSFKDQLKT